MKSLWDSLFTLTLAALSGGDRAAAAPDQNASPTPVQSRTAVMSPALKEYRDYAMGAEGNAARGRELFLSEQRTACVKCHSVDGSSSSKAGPDLFAVGDKFPRRELISAMLEPSASIAVGYGTTIVETKSGEEYQGILKQITADALELVGADGKSVGIATSEIKEQRGSTLSLMPEGLDAGMSRQDFTDLIEYLVTLKQPENALTSNRGMPANIPELAKPIEVRPFYGVYVCGDYTSHRIFGLKQQDRALQVVRQIGTAPQGIASFATDERGEIYLVGYEGMVYHLGLAGINFDDEMKATATPAPTAAAGKIDQQSNGWRQCHDAKLIPGHGPLSTVKELKEFHEMLAETSGIVEKAIAAGKTLEQVKADGLPDKWKSWAVPTLTTSRWLEILYRGLSSK